MKISKMMLSVIMILSLNASASSDADLTPFLRTFTLVRANAGFLCHAEITGYAMQVYGAPDLRLGSFYFPSVGENPQIIDDEMVRIETRTTVSGGTVTSRQRLLTKTSGSLSVRTEKAILNGASLRLTSKATLHSPGEPSFTSYDMDCSYRLKE
ncbi:MAG: hypothetical protein AB7F86_11275 [Bdellovibrionales bacterium]